MLNRYLQFYDLADCPQDNEDAAMAVIRESFPKKKTRRMSRLGILLAHVLRNVPLEGIPIIYASRYTETRALEKYLDSFPDASPTQFQTSIHPGGIQQALILHQVPVARLFPLAGGNQLLITALQHLFLFEDDRVLLVGGEESGTWMLDFGLAASRSFAFASLFSKSPAGASMKISWEQNHPVHEILLPELSDWAQSMAQNSELVCQHPDFGKFTISPL